MKTSINSLNVSYPNCDGVVVKKVTIATEGGDLMTNRLRRVLRNVYETRINPEDKRITVDIPDELVFQIVESYVRKSKAMRRMDRALDRKTQENKDLETLAQYIFGLLADMTAGSEGFIHAILDARDGGDGLLTQVTEPLETLQRLINDANTLIAEIGEETDEAESCECGCDCADCPEWGAEKAP